LCLLVSIGQVQAYTVDHPAVTKQRKIEQQRTISGQVLDETGMPLPGASVAVKGTQNITMTDFDGKFALKINEGDRILVVSFVGYESTEVQIENKSVYAVSIQPVQEGLKEVVVVGFGTQKKESMVSSITTINPKELKGPTSNLTNMLAGRVSGLVAYQRTGEPGADNSDFFIRGLGTFGTGKRSPLILIDNIESTATDMARLQPDDIEAFSVLKDAAAAAVYGARGANGVVLITTKSGKEGKTKFSFRSETRVSSNTKNFQFADNITYMNLANEAALTRNRDAILPYTQTKIDRTAAGENPYLYPDNNWISELVKDYTVNQGFNLSASGGGEKAKYYVSGTYNIDNGVLNVEGLNNFNSNIKLRNYSLRTNVDIDLTPTTRSSIRNYAQFDDYNGPVGGGQQIFNYAVWSNPVRFPKVFPSNLLPYVEHPLFGGALSTSNTQTANLMINPYAEMVRGYAVSKASTIQSQIELKQDLNAVTEGLSASAMAYVRRYSYYNVFRNYNPFYYQGSLDPTDSESIVLQVLNDGGSTSVGTTGTEYLGYREGGKNLDSRIYVQGSLNYNRTFNEKHDVSGMLVSLLSSYETGNAGNVESSLASRNQGVSGRFTYGYDKRYLAEFNFGYNGSEKFASGHRYGFFPSFGLAYNISNEKFWEPIKDVITDFKLRGTYGLVGNDQIASQGERFYYLSSVDLNSGTYGARFGETLDGNSANGVFVSRYANLNIGWEESEQLNLGFDLQIDNALTINVDAYEQTRSSIYQARTNIGSTIGLTSSPATNFAKIKSKGVDVAATYNKQFNNDWYTQLRGNFTYATNEWKQFDEVTYPENLSYLSVIGNNVSQTYGLIAERLFIDDEEVANSPTQFGTYGAGDIKYRDVNGDGVINQNDVVPLGDPTVPKIIYGFGGVLGYKQFDFSVFFQGSAQSSFFINPENIAPFVMNTVFNTQLQEDQTFQNGLLNAVAESHWSEDNRDSYAFFPRLSDRFVENNNRVSNWWMRDGSFLRLKTVEVGYNVPESFTSKLGINTMRIYASGNNLAVWSRFKLWDPEMGGNGLGYPIQSVYNFGLKLDF